MLARRHPVLLGAKPRKRASWMPQGAKRFPGTVGVRSKPRKHDAAGTQNELRSHGRYRCLVISRIPAVRLPVDT